MTNQQSAIDDRNAQLRATPYETRIKECLAGHPMTNWKDNLQVLLDDMLEEIRELRACRGTLPKADISGFFSIHNAKFTAIPKDKK